MWPMEKPMANRQERAAQIFQELLEEGWDERDIGEIGLDIYEYTGNDIVIIEESDEIPELTDTIH